MHVIFLDKNHPNQAGVAKAIKEIEHSFSSNSVTLKKVFLIPELTEENQFEDYPFSQNFLAQVYAWAQNRTTHETLDNDDPVKTVEVQSMFIKMHKGTIYN